MTHPPKVAMIAAAWGERSESMQEARGQRSARARAKISALAGPDGRVLRLFEPSDWTAAMAEFLLHLERKGIAPGTVEYTRAIAAFDEGWWGRPADDGPPGEGAAVAGRIEW